MLQLQNRCHCKYDKLQVHALCVTIKRVTACYDEPIGTSDLLYRRREERKTKAYFNDRGKPDDAVAVFIGRSRCERWVEYLTTMIAIIFVMHQTRVKCKFFFYLYILQYTYVRRDDCLFENLNSSKTIWTCDLMKLFLVQSIKSSSRQCERLLISRRH